MDDIDYGVDEDGNLLLQYLSHLGELPDRTDAEDDVHLAAWDGKLLEAVVVCQCSRYNLGTSLAEAFLEQ